MTHHRNGIGPLRKEEAFISITIREMEDLDKLRRFMRQMIKMWIHRATYDPHFGTATERFVEACRAIANDAASPRLASLVQRLFGGTPLVSELAPQSYAAGQTPHP